MKARIISSLAAAGVLALVVSCGQDQNRGALVPTEASFAKPPAPPSCSFTTADQDAKAYFSASRDPVYGLLDVLQTAYKSGVASTTNDAGFDVLARLAAANNTAGDVKATATPAMGSKFANDVLLCMSVAGYVNTSPVDFSAPLATGIFAIRDGSSTEPVASRTTDQYGPLFGAEPNPPGSSWPLAGKTLFYGWQVSPETLAGEGVSGTVFELRTLPSGLTFTPPIRAGVCFIDDADARILHLHASDATILPPAGAPSFCHEAQVNLGQGASPFAFAVRTLGSWLAPQPAHAARAMMPPLGGGGGGLVSGLSEIGPVEFTATLAFVANIPNAARRDTTKALDGNPATSQFSPMIRVRAASAVGNPLAGVAVHLTVVGNQGSFLAHNVDAVTDADGIATFTDIYIDKSGGYTITASAPEFGTLSVLSNLFNITGK